MLLNRRISSILPSSSWRKCLSTVEASKAVGEEQKKTRPVRTRSKEKLAYLEAFRKRNAELEEKAKNSNLPWRIMGAT
jgi:DNA-directed RNA polymerase subunit F